MLYIYKNKTINLKKITLVYYETATSIDLYFVPTFSMNDIERSLFKITYPDYVTRDKEYAKILKLMAEI